MPDRLLGVLALAISTVTGGSEGGRDTAATGAVAAVTSALPPTLFHAERRNVCGLVRAEDGRAGNDPCLPAALRDRAVLEQIASDIGWPSHYERVVAAASGLYRGQAPGVPTWSGYQQSIRLDISHPQWWIRVSVGAGPYGDYAVAPE